MSRIKKPARLIKELYLNSNKRLSEETERFYLSIYSLGLEGRPSMSASFSIADSALRSLKRSLKKMTDQEEKCLYPFVKTHIPRLEPLIYLLSSEHDDSRELIKKIEADIKAARRSRPEKRGAIANRIRGLGIYLMCLLRSHLWIERKKIFQAIDQELRPSEKDKLAAQLIKCHRSRALAG